MKMSVKKPKGYGVADMEVIEHYNPVPKKGRQAYAIQLRYPKGHPMRVYKDMKRALK